MSEDTRRTIDALLDAAPAGVRSQITDVVAHVDGVLEVDRARIRRAGNHYFADLVVGFAYCDLPALEQLVAAVTAAVQRILPDADVTVQCCRARRIQKIFLTASVPWPRVTLKCARHQRAGP